MTCMRSLQGWMPISVHAKRKHWTTWIIEQTPTRRDDSVPVLLVGSSIIRDISSKDDAKLQVKSLSGAKIADIHHEIGRAKEKYSQIIIHVGSNDCDKDDMNLDNVVIGYNKLISEAKKCFAKVALSSVLPRCGKHVTNDRIYRLNADLLAKETGCDFK